MKANFRTCLILVIQSLFVFAPFIVQAGPEVASKSAGHYGVLTGRLEKPWYDLVGVVQVTKNPDSAVLILTITPSNPQNPSLTAKSQQWTSPQGATSLRGTYTNYTPILDSFDAFGAHEVRGKNTGFVVYTHTTHFK